MLTALITRNMTRAIMLARWRPGDRCAPHDHGGAGGFVIVLDGEFDERRFAWDSAQLIVAENATRCTGTAMSITSDVIHDMGAADGGLTLHLYSPPATSMRTSVCGFRQNEQ